METRGRRALGRARAPLWLCSVATLLLADSSAQTNEIVTVFNEALDEANSVVRASYRPPEPLPVTLTVRFDLINTITDRPVPVTLVLRKAGELDVVKLSRRDRSARWQFHYDSHWVYGDRDAFHEHDAYRLPYTSGETAVVGQGFHGTFSHQGANAYAIDFLMPVGTPVRAARGGRVVGTRDDVAETVRSLPPGQPDPPANFVHILHDDGTIGRYYHLRRRGVQVRVGQSVRAGDLIAFSGDTGLSSEPHLHFDVSKPVDGYTVESLPIRFDVAGEVGPIELQEGGRYEAR
jgi:murein DD-endopeptidase MepM/ murein hydrolase activator NlpD